MTDEPRDGEQPEPQRPPAPNATEPDAA
ncbi:MAG: hypothetical protein QOC82_1237, partial [Frankiaceae bacterium]|nr:hypothetical protein [Frankiaceae bacterium]